MTKEDIMRMAEASGVEDSLLYEHWRCNLESMTRFAALVASAERAFCHQLMLDFIEEFMGYEKDRHPMFSEGYDLALYHMKKLIEGDKHD